MFCSGATSVLLQLFLWCICLRISGSLFSGARLGTFPTPDFQTSFVLSSNQGNGSFKEIRHGLKKEPLFIRLYAVARNGSNQGFSFDAIGSSQDSSSRSGYGGLIYAYNDECVRVWAPTDPSGRVIFVKDGWGGEVHAGESDEAEVFVKIWLSFPEPTFQLELEINPFDSAVGSYREVIHDLRQRPELVVVNISPVGNFHSELNPNHGFWFPGIAASQNRASGAYGGVIFAYNEVKVRLWAPHRANSGCVFVGSSWAGGLYSQRTTHCTVQVKLWVNQLPVPSFKTPWFPFKGQQGQNSFKEITHNLGTFPPLVRVQLRATSGINYGYIFEGQGSIQSGGDNSDGYGGVLFAYDNQSVRLWAPSDNGTKKGFPLLVKGSSWGNNSNHQDGLSHYDALVRVVVYSGKCDEAMETAYIGNQCPTSLYEFYMWKHAKSWSDCSSICNIGVQEKPFTGCQVTSRNTVRSWDFEKGMDGWTSSSISGQVEWRRTDTSTVDHNTGPMWGHPKGSFYVYTHTAQAAPQSQALLTSPELHGPWKCHLHFYWSMYGRDIGTLSLQVYGRQPWKDSGWKMIGPQGPVYWRAGFVNLEEFGSITRLRFVHILPERVKPCSGNCVCKQLRCTDANVAIDDVRLVCDAVHSVVETDVCRARSVPFAGCPRDATAFTTTGPAYGTVKTAKDGLLFVNSSGQLHDKIASYDFDVLFAGDYVLWMEMFGTADNRNDISFRVDEGSWYEWLTPTKSHSLWTQFRHKVFALQPGIHTVTLRQDEAGFRFHQLILAPVNFSMWTPLGLQSRHIPDSYLTANPKTGSKPEPRFGRLNGKEAWCSADHNKGYVYFQVRLPSLALLTRIAIQGGIDLFEKSNNYWLINFRMKISIDGTKFTWYRDISGRRTFQANTDASTITTHELMFAAPVRAVRIYPWNWHNWICLRLELYGYYLPSGLCAATTNTQETIRPCTGDRNCGNNAECRKMDDTGIPSQGRSANEAQPLNSSASAQLETCYCKPGHHGPSCEHKGCSPNPCKNNGTCRDVADHFTCACSPGYYGNLCQHPCKKGFYGQNCSNKCQCGVHGSCDFVTGRCSCERGYNGTYCKQQCVAGYYGYDCRQKCACQNGASCDAMTGSCNCTSGWTGAFCELPCPKDSWGEGCNTSCSCSASASACDRFTGGCICSDGFHGKLCELKCPRGSYGRNCSRSCRCNDVAGCSHVDGTCNCTRPGLTGVLCDQPCHAGFFGVDCAESCQCHDGATCDRMTGDCICPIGWTGVTCNTSCPQGYWGRNCTLPCTCSHGAQCNPTNGNCECTGNCTCDSWWTGIQCNVPCPLGTWGPNCTEVCACVNGGKCHKESGTCSCSPGFSGQKCETPCSDDRYGVDCLHNCSCRPDTSRSCDSVSGLCRCVAGWQGQTCGIPCPGGLWGMNCSKTCRCVHGSCDPTSGNCTCDRGWQGARCDQPCSNCSGPCKCYHGNSSTGCGNCTCHPGYRGSSCLEACQAGFYGDRCGVQCTCANGGLCNNSDGSCDCSPGWTGAKCEQGCPPGKFGSGCQQSCACVNGSCDPTSGACSCDAGYHGESCDVACPVGFFGNGCQSVCRCMNGAGCDHVTGKCACAPGWTGAHCDGTCAQGFYGNACSERCSCPRDVSCDHVHGTCRCPAGWQGPTCAQACPEGHYGPACSQACSCQNNATCDHVNGTCTCTPGWTGADCSLPCPAKSYGMFCGSECDCEANFTDPSRPCGPVTGQCMCKPGFRGLRCLERCPPGTYGDECSQICSCQNDATCQPLDGACVCLPGYRGDHCESVCGDNEFGVGCTGTCKCVREHTRSCDHVDGSCTCLTGYAGLLCENTCSEGTYGPACAINCTCQNGAHCDHVTGTCSCMAGFGGRDCAVPCAEGTFGPGCAQRCLCKNGAKCDPITGRCYCAPGYQGLFCTVKCLQGRFGVNCTRVCDCHTRNVESCDHRDGTCRCGEGFTGPRCGQTCKPGFHGNNCEKPCPQCTGRANGTCDHVSGACPCLPGYSGAECYDDCPLTNYGPRCNGTCSCRRTDICHHVTGACLDVSRGKFSLTFSDAFIELDIPSRRRNLKLGLEALMNTYYDEYAAGNMSTETAPADARMKRSQLTQNSSSDRQHNFMARLLDLRSVALESGGEGSQGVFVLLDGQTVVDGATVMAVLERAPDQIDEFLDAQVYRGEVRPERPTGGSVIKSHLPLIIGSSVGVVMVLGILVACVMMRRKRHAAVPSYKRNAKSQSEIELQSCISGGSGYLLAFDNPYYDVLAAMGLYDDDVEEDFYNPLYDDASMCSDTEDGCDKTLSAMVIR